MDIEFHYYITYILARKAGFDENDSYVIAYASQYTDDNSYQYYVNFKSGDDYLSKISQTVDITKPSIKREKIYPLYHFVPGYPDSPEIARKDGAKHLFNTTPDSKNVKYLFHKALESKNLYRIGVGTHVYADSWAHQNFLGLGHQFNAIPKALNVIIPNIGHADALTIPDMIGHRWEDPRLVEEDKKIDNNKRFLEAAEKIFFAFCSYKNPTKEDNLIKNDWDKLKEDLIKAMHARFLLWKRQGARIKSYQNIYNDIPHYDPNEWRYAALSKRGLEEDLFDRYWAQENFYESRWYQFQEAIKEHYDLSFERLKPLYVEAGLDI